MIFYQFRKMSESFHLFQNTETETSTARPNTIGEGEENQFFTIHLLFIHLLIRFANPSILFIQSPIKRRPWLTLHARKGVLVPWYVRNYGRQAAIVAKLLLPNCGGGRLNVTGDCPPFYGTRQAGLQEESPTVYEKVIVGKWS